MKKILLFTISFFAFLLNAFSQKIHFSDSSNHWHTVFTDNLGHSYHFDYYYGNDTVINGKVYRLLNNTNFDIPGVFAIREDTVNNIVYQFEVSVDTVERVLYNYNLHLGDTISLPSRVLSPTTYTDSVAKIDSTLINGVYHKIFYLMDYRNINAVHSYVYMEGIGCLNSPLYPPTSTCFETSEVLLCFRQDASYPSFLVPFLFCFSSVSDVVDTFVNLSSCIGFPNGVANTVKGNNVSVLPNPALGFIVAKTRDNWGQGCVFSVFDITGRCVYKASLEANKNETEINTSNWRPGVYLINIRNDKGIVKQEKFVVK